VIIRVKHARNYTVIENRTLQDPRLSFKATGVLAYLLSLPDDWRVSRDDLANRKADGVASVRTAMSELEAAGYLTRHRERLANGTFQTTVEVREVSQPGEDFTPPAADNPPTVDPPTEIQPSLLSTQTKDTDKLPSGELTRQPGADIDFEAFWSAYPKRQGVKSGKGPARKQWARLKDAERGEAVAELSRYATASRGYPRDAERYLRDRLWVGLEVETVEDRDARVIANAESLASFLHVEGF
jgi:hypothetical protein